MQCIPTLKSETRPKTPSRVYPERKPSKVCRTLSESSECSKFPKHATLLHKPRRTAFSAAVFLAVDPRWNDKLWNNSASVGGHYRHRRSQLGTLRSGSHAGLFQGGDVVSCRNRQGSCGAPSQRILQGRIHPFVHDDLWVAWWRRVSRERGKRGLRVRTFVIDTRQYEFSIGLRARPHVVSMHFRWLPIAPCFQNFILSY